MNLKYISSFAIGPIISAAFGLITIPFLTWFFSVEDIGRFTMVQITLGLTVSLLSLAMHQAYVREYHEQDDKTVLLKAAMAPGLLLLFLTIIFTVVSPISVSKLLFGIESGWLTSLMLMSVIAIFFLNFLSHILRMEERGLAFSLTQIMPRMTLLIFIGIIILLDLPSNFLVLISSNSLSLIATLICFILLTFNSWKNIFKVSLNFSLMKGMLKFSLPLVAGGLAYWGLTAIDRFFLRALSGFDELGLYSVGVTIVSAVSVITAVFSNIWHPTVYRWVKEGIDPKRVQSVIEFMTIGFSTIWSIAGLFSWIVPMFLPSEYGNIAFLVVASIAMPLFYLLSETTVVGIGISRRSGYAMLASIAAVIVNAVLNYLLIPSYGAAGAALATCYSFFVFFVVRTESSAYLWISLPRLKVYIVVSSYLIVTTAVFICSQVLDVNNILFFSILWTMLLIGSLLIYKDRSIQVYLYLKSQLMRFI